MQFSKWKLPRIGIIEIAIVAFGVALISAVIVPVYLSSVCREDIQQCKIDNPNLYKNLVNKNPTLDPTRRKENTVTLTAKNGKFQVCFENEKCYNVTVEEQ